VNLDGKYNSRELCTPRLVTAATVAEAIDVRPATGIFMRSISLMMMLDADALCLCSVSAHVCVPLSYFA
jgi:hypothetical protein